MIDSASSALRLWLLAAALAGAGVLCTAWGLSLRLATARLDDRLGTYVRRSPAPVRPRAQRRPLRARLAPLFAPVAGVVDHVLPERQIAQIRTNLAAAGLSSTRDLPAFLAAKALLAGMLAAAAALLVVEADGPLGKVLLLAAIGGLAGFYLPGIWLGKRIARRRQQLARALPDALDLLSISVSAGLGFDSAMLEVVQRWANPLTEEFAAVLRDMRLGKDRRQALRSLADRTGVPEVRSVVAAVIQADELGTPVRDTLRVQADQMRLQRRQQAEERARQATIKMLIPMAVFIFPTIFVVLIGPAVPSFMGLVKR